MRNFLIISPSAEVVDLINTSLSQEYRVTAVDNVDGALAEIKKRPSDVVFADLSILRNTASDQSCTAAILSLKKSHPRLKVVVLAPKEQIREAVKVVKSSADDYLTYPIDPSEIQLVADALSDSLNQDLELDYLRDQFWKTEWIDVIRTRNAGMQEALKKIRAVAPTIATALLTGETGTGKGLVARILHRHSNRSENPFISVHCGAIPDTLLESELFGHEKGAFTGAVRRKPGKFELARGGTIFLDEIGTVSPSAQIKLLQVLQDGTFSRVGGEEVLTTDARIIAATNANLAAMSEKGGFRKDLFYRLNVFPIKIPPLRDRLEDIDFLSEVFLNNLNQKYGKNIRSIHAQVMHAFKNYHWPGNIRELENLIERSYILETSNLLTPETFPADLFESGATAATAVMPLDVPLPLSEARRQAIDDFERRYLKELFTRNKGKVSLTAEEAGVSTRQLNKLMIKYGIRKESFKE